jgi:hypothetical protein
VLAGRLIEDTAGRMGVPLPAASAEMAVALDALVDGFALHKLVDREQIPSNLIARAMRWLLTGVVVEARGGLETARPGSDTCR